MASLRPKIGAVHSFWVCLPEAATRIIPGADLKLAHAILQTRRHEAKPGGFGCVLQLWDDALALEIEQHAVEIARGAGRILAGHFGKEIAVEFKDEHERDPVTAADKEAQEYLVAEIAKRFPDHGILGEEGTKEEKESEEPAKDILWVLDPLDGTTNFMNGDRKSVVWGQSVDLGGRRTIKKKTTHRA